MSPGGLPFLGAECPVCGHSLRFVLVDGRLTLVCPCCGFTRR